MLRYLLPSFSLTSTSPTETLIQVLFKGGELWFLYVLFLCFLLQPVLGRILPSKGSAVIGCVIIWGLYALLPEIEWFCLSSVLFYFPFFMLGAALKKPCLNRLTSPGQGIKTWGLVIALFIVDVLLGRAREAIDSTLIARLLRVVRAIPGIWIAVEVIRLVHNRLFTDAFKRLGQYSLELYLFNGYFVSVSRTLCSMLHLGTVPAIAINLLFLVPVNYIWVYLITKIRPVRFICGR